MKKLSAFIFAFIVMSTSAFAITCAELQDLEKQAGTYFSESPYETINVNQLTLMVDQLRIALKKNDFDGEDVDKMSAKKLDEAAQGAIFKIYKIGAEKFQGVNVGAGDNPFIFLFEMDSKKLTGIECLDGSLYINGKYCKIKNKLQFNSDCATAKGELNSNKIIIYKR